jgi:hypothetical protein
MLVEAEVQAWNSKFQLALSFARQPCMSGIMLSFIFYQSGHTNDAAVIFGHDFYQSLL